MRIIKIFLASSEELKVERKEMADLVQDLNFSLNNRGISLQLVKWEYLNSDMGPEHKQEEYNRELRECEMCVVVFWTRFGTYTKKELDVAYEGRCTEGRNPQRLWVYFKDGSELSEELRNFRESFTKNYEHFCSFFVNIDTLKYDFLSQFIKYLGLLFKDNFANIEDSKVVIDGKVYVNLKNVPSFANNEEYQRLLKDIKKTEKLLAVTSVEDDDYREYADDLQKLTEQRKLMESSMWDTALLIAELRNKTCSERLMRAIELFNKGDNKGARAILNEEEISRDAKHNLNLIRLGEEGKKGLETNIDELLLKIRTLMNDREEGWYLQVEHLYDTCVEWGRGNVPKKKMLEIFAGYSDFLRNQRNYSKAQIILHELLAISRQLAKDKTSDNMIMLAATLNDMALVEWANKHFLKSERKYTESLNILRHLSLNESSNPIILPLTICNLASLYVETKRFSESESLYKESLDIYRRLAKSNFTAYAPYLATTLGNLATLYSNLNRFSESELLYKESLEIYRCLTKENASVYESMVAMVLGNLATLYYNMNCYQQGEALYQESLELCRFLAKRNPSAYEPDLARILCGLATLYLDANRYSESESLYNDSLEIYRRLASSNNSAYEPDLATTLNNLASLYLNIRRFSESEGCYNEALDVYRRLARFNHSVYEPDLARTLGNLAILLYNTNRHLECEVYYIESLEIYRRLARHNNSVYGPELARTLCNIADFYTGTNRFIDSDIMLNEALDLYHSLYTSSRPSLYGPKIASTLGCMAFNTMFLKKFVEAEHLSREAMAIDSSQTFIYTNLASSLLFQGKVMEAEAIYSEYKPVEKYAFLDDFKRFEELGIIPEERKEDVERIKKMLKDE